MPMRSSPDPATLSRAQGCLLGQLAGDALGGLVEFQSASTVRSKRPRSHSAVWPSDTFVASQDPVASSARKSTPRDSENP
jgi:ADP-ribosylglycohydrolase